jgi:hypothetical protein
MCLLPIALFMSAGLSVAQEHVVPISELRGQMADTAQTRQSNIAKIDNLLMAAKAPTSLRGAINLLNDDELARLAARAEKAQGDVTAGALSNQELTYIVIALATAVIVIVIVLA